MKGYAFFTGGLVTVLLFGLAPPVFPAGGGGSWLGLSPRFLWSVSAETEKNLINRWDLRLALPGAGLSLRGQLTDRRPAAIESLLGENFNGGISAFGGGLYHEATGSRLIHGVLDEWGLPARLRGPWGRGVPFPENHKPQAADLRTEPSAVKEPETYLYLGFNPGGPAGGFVSALLENDLVPAFGGGLNVRFGKKTELRAEGFYTARELPPRKSSAWFSERPPLPERDFRFYALGFLLQSPRIGLSSDWGYSETFAYGRDLYGNLGLRLGEGPWQFSLAADGAGDRYVGRDGSAPGGGFRFAARLERKGSRNGLFRLGTSLRAPGLGEPFERSSSQFYYRFPSPPARAAPAPRFSRVSLVLSRNGSDREKIEDRLEGTAGLKWGAWTAVVQGSLGGQGKAEGVSPPFPDNSAEFASAALSGELGYSPGLLSFSVKLGCTAKTEKDPVWETAFYASIRGKPGRLSLKVASPEFPARWTGTIAGRLELR